MQHNLYATGILKGRETEYCKTNSSMEFGYFGVVTYARNLESEGTPKYQRISIIFLGF